MKYDMKYTLYDMKCGILRQNLMTTIKGTRTVTLVLFFYGFVVLGSWKKGTAPLRA